MLSYVNLATIKRHWILVVVSAIVGAVAAFGLSALMTPLFKSTATLYFTLNFGNTASDLAQGSTYTSNQMLSFGEVTTSPAVLDPVIKELGLDTTSKDLARSVDVSTPRDTVIMEISVTDPASQRAADIANAVADQTRTIIEEYAPQMQNGKPSVQVRTIAAALPSPYQFTPDKRLNTGVGLALGGLVGVLLSFLLAALDNRIRNAESLTSVGSVPYLGSLRRRPDAVGHEAVVLQEPASQASEEYRQVRSSLRFATMSKHPLALVVSSSVPGEGKTTVATNLAAVLAESGQRTLLIDADLRKPLVAAYTHVSGALGLSDILVEASTLAESVQPLGLSGVDVLTAGDVPPNPGEMVASARMAELLREAKQSYDVVIIDTAPILAVADALALTAGADGMLLVARSARTTKHDLRLSLDATRASGATVFGVVINGEIPRSDSSLRDYRYTVSATPVAPAADEPEPRPSRPADPRPDPDDPEGLVDDASARRAAQSLG